MRYYILVVEGEGSMNIHLNIICICLLKAYILWHYVFQLFSISMKVLSDLSLISRMLFLRELNYTFNFKMVNFGKKLAANQIQEWKE